MRSTFKILFYVKKGSEKPNGNLPLMCRLTVDGEVKQLSCKMDVPPRLWDVKNGRATDKSLEAQKINTTVDRIRVDVNRHYQELMRSDGYVTAAKLKDAYLGIGVKQETLVKLFEQHNVEFAKKVGHSRTKGKYSRYRTNKSLKEIANMVGLSIPLTLYVARHSWASIAKSKNIPISVISEGMGHDSEMTTQIYLASLDNAVVDRANAQILKEL